MNQPTPGIPRSTGLLIVAALTAPAYGFVAFALYVPIFKLGASV